MDPAWVHLADHARRRHATISWRAATALGIPGSTLTSWAASGPADSSRARRDDHRRGA
jgi:hypothetical protein